MIEENNCCILCGEIVPEGFQYCTRCLEDVISGSGYKKYDNKNTYFDISHNKKRKSKKILGNKLFSLLLIFI